MTKLFILFLDLKIKNLLTCRHGFYASRQHGLLPATPQCTISPSKDNDNYRHNFCIPDLFLHPKQWQQDKIFSFLFPVFITTSTSSLPSHPPGVIHDGSWNWMPEAHPCQDACTCLLNQHVSYSESVHCRRTQRQPPRWALPKRAQTLGISLLCKMDRLSSLNIMPSIVLLASALLTTLDCKSGRHIRHVFHLLQSRGAENCTRILPSRKLNNWNHVVLASVAFVLGYYGPCQFNFFLASFSHGFSQV